MFQLLAGRSCISSFVRIFVSRSCQKRIYVVVREADSTSTETDSVVRDAAGFDELVDAGLADAESRGDVFDGRAFNIFSGCRVVV